MPKYGCSFIFWYERTILARIILSTFSDIFTTCNSVYNDLEIVAIKFWVDLAYQMSSTETSVLFFKIRILSRAVDELSISR